MDPEDIKTENTNALDQLLDRLLRTASSAADEMHDALHHVGQAASGTYETVKAKLDLGILQDEQNKIFTQIGRLLFLSLPEGRNQPPSPETLKKAERAVSGLLVQADQKQQEIDLLSQRLAGLAGHPLCPACGEAVTAKNAFCPACGAKLKDNL